MIWFLNWLLHSREPEEGIYSLNTVLSSDLRQKSTKVLTAEVGTTPLITRPPEKPGRAAGWWAQHLEDSVVVVHTNPFSRLRARMRVL